MNIALVVLNYNDSDNTIKFVNSIKGYNIINKIVIVDNSSTNENEIDLLYKLKDKKIDVIKTEKNGGYSYGNNFGLKYLDNKYPNKYRYVIISNPDVSVKEENIKIVIDNMELNDKIALASPRMNFVCGPARRAAWKERTLIVDIANSTRLTQLLLFPFFKKGEYSKKDYGNEILNVDNIAGSFFIARHEVFKDIGYFDERTFLFYEEDIVSYKLRKKGYIIQLFNNINFMHYESKTIGKVMNLYRKIDILFDSKIYYQREYNNVGVISILIFNFLRICRKIELLFEIPIKKYILK